MPRVTLDLPSEVTPEHVRLFVRLQQLETWLRELVYVETKCNYADRWWDRCFAALQRANRVGIPPARARERDQQHPHMATPENDPLWFISFDSLLTILFDRYLWPLFRPCLTTKRLVRAKFEELKPVRNRIAHTRAIHRDDLRRVENVMRDLDSGIWTFCTSYNNLRPFVADYQHDPVFQHFVARMGGGYYETTPGEWSYLANRTNMTMDMDLAFAIRPSSPGPRTGRSAKGRGVFYRARYSVAHTQRSFRTADILASTKAVHPSVLHLHIDSLHAMLTVTLPSLLANDTIIAILERFFDVCQNEISALVVNRPGPDDDPQRWHEQLTNPTTALAAEWPHYVIPPVNPLTFLDPTNPCSFFGV